MPSAELIASRVCGASDVLVQMLGVGVGVGAGVGVGIGGSGVSTVGGGGGVAVATGGEAGFLNRSRRIVEPVAVTNAAVATPITQPRHAGAGVADGISVVSPAVEFGVAGNAADSGRRVTGAPNDGGTGAGSPSRKQALSSRRSSAGV